ATDRQTIIEGREAGEAVDDDIIQVGERPPQLGIAGTQQRDGYLVDVATWPDQVGAFRTIIGSLQHKCTELLLEAKVPLAHRGGWKTPFQQAHIRPCRNNWIPLHYGYGRHASLQLNRKSDAIVQGLISYIVAEPCGTEGRPLPGEHVGVKQSI